MTEQRAVQRRLRNRRRWLRVLAVVVSVAVLLGCADRLHATIGVWGVFVMWAVAGVVAAAWPLAFLVIGIGRAPRGGRAVCSAALGITLSSIGLVLLGWGLVMVLAPEYTVGWYFPARGGNGTEIDDVTEALDAGRLAIAVGALWLVVVAAIAVAAAHRGPTPDDTETQGEESAERTGPTIAVLGGMAGLLMVLCGVLFWVVSLGIGLISMIQYDGVRERLAECLPGVRSCSTEIWVANQLPWVLVVGSVLALLAFGVALWTASSWMPWPGDSDGDGRDDGAGLGVTVRRVLVGGGIFHAGSVVALTSAILYARWSDSTCRGRGSLRSCGAQAPEFSFVQEWAPWVTVWALAVYAVVAYLVVFGALAGVEEELADGASGDREPRTRSRPGAGRARAGSPRSSASHVAVHLLAVAVLCGAGWSGISARHLGSSPAAWSGPWREYVEETMSTAEHPHLDEVSFEIPSGDDPEIPLTVQITLEGEGPEMPSAEALGLIDAACAYTVSPWRATTPETWVRVTHRLDGDNSRYALLDCGSDHRRALGEQLRWHEQHPASSAVAKISIKSREGGVLETQYYLADSSTPTVRAALAQLCSLPPTTGVRRSGTLFDATATREVGDIDCSDPERVLAEWRSHD